MDSDGTCGTVNLASLQRIYMIRLQRDLLKEAITFRYEIPDTERSYYMIKFRETVHNYGSSKRHCKIRRC